MNESNFAGLKYFPDQRLNIRQIENIDTKSILRGNVRELLGVMNDLAYIDVENDEYVGGTPEAKKLYKLCQYGLQYMMYTVTKLGDNTLLLRDYLQIQDDKKKKLQELLQQQEETIKNLKQKKKSLHETEKNYQTLLRTLNLENSAADPRDMRRLSSFDSDPERREDTVPLNLPRGPQKRNNSRDAGTEKSPGMNYSNQPRGNSYDNRDRVGYSNDPRGYLNESDLNPSHQNQTNVSQQYNNNSTLPQDPDDIHYSQYGTPQPGNYQQSRNIREPVRIEDSYANYQQQNVPQKSSNDTPPRDGNQNKFFPNQDMPSRRPGTSYGQQVDNKEDNSKKEEEAKKFNTNITGRVPIRAADQKKPKNDDYEDEYEDDFELSESLAPDNTKIPLRFGKGQQNVQGNSDKKRDDAEETISMDFDKEFNKNYLDNLDKLVNKNKPGVEVPVKRFS